MDCTAMTSQMTRDLNDIAEKYRKPYTKYIDELSERYNDESGFWWDTPLASRNTYFCQCFWDICVLRLILDYVSRHNAKQIIVGNNALRQAVLDNMKDYMVHITAQKKYGFKATLKRSHWIRSEYNFYHFQKRIRTLQKYRRNATLASFYGRELTLVSTYRVPAEIGTGVLQDRYFPGMKENTDEDIVFLALSVFDSEAEGKWLLDVLHASEDHICIEDWIEPNDFKEVREYIRWCRKVSVPQCMFDGMDVTALVKEALRIGASDNNAMYGIVKGRALCRLVEQYDLKIKCLIDWYEGQPSSNAMVRRFRKKFPDVPTVACSHFPYGENWLSLFPSKLQVEKKVVPEYFSVMGKAWKAQITQFGKDVKCITVPSFRHSNLFETKEEEPFERKGILLVLPYFIDAATQMLRAFGEAIQELNSKRIGPIYIKNHPVNQNMRLSDYGIREEVFQDWDVTYLKGDMYKALQGKAVAILSKTTSTLEAMLSGVYTINFIPAGELSEVSLPEVARSKITIAYTAKDLRACLRSPQKGLSPEEVEQLCEAAFTRVNRENVADFLELRPMCDVG